MEGEGPLHLRPLRGPRVRTGERNGGQKCPQGNLSLQANDLPVAYLCGQEPYCMLIGDQRALRQAKRNVEQSFPVVGVLEELSKTKLQTQPHAISDCLDLHVTNSPHIWCLYSVLAIDLIL